MRYGSHFFEVVVSILLENDLSPMSDSPGKPTRMDTLIKMDTPLSQSSTSLKLEEIQKRCGELLEKPDELAELTLEEPVSFENSNDPYNRICT